MNTDSKDILGPTGLDMLGNSKVVETCFSDQWNPVVYFKLVYLLKSISIRFGEPVAIGKAEIPSLLLGNRLVLRKF